jgi:tetratricopeptide (TPR) repeat protein
LQDNSADYAAARTRRPTHAGGGSRARRAPRTHAPRMPSSAGYLLTTAFIAVAIFAGVWWLFYEVGDETAWMPAVVCAALVLLVSVAAREVVMRRAWARYSREMEAQMGAPRAAAPGRSGAHARKASVQAAASSLRALQQGLATAEEAGAQQPGAHLEAFRLCEQYLANAEEAIHSSRTSPEVRAALHAGQERVRESQRHHLLSWARGETQRLTREAQRRASVSGKIETATNALDVIGEALQFYPEERELRDSAIAVRNYVASVKVAHWVELGERAAFRGRYNRAIARYRDALFYLSRAEMGDDARDEAAARIHREIEMLRARVATGEIAPEIEVKPSRPRAARKGAKPGSRKRAAKPSG